MIFVLLGIIILIVSFVIALVSLVREQKRLEDQEGQRVDEVKAEVIEQEKREEQIIAVETSQSATRREPFVWETAADLGQDEVDSQVKTNQLALLDQKIAQAWTQAKELNQVTSTEAEVEKIEQGRSGLYGEINFRDLKH